MIDLTSKPFNLTDDDIPWIKETLAGMDLQAKVEQLFCILGRTPDEDKLKEILRVIKPGAVMFRPAPGGSIQKAHRFLQENSDIPLLLAANLERGGIGIATDGTHFASPLQVAATDDETVAYRLGLVCGREGRTVGCNWAFAPVVDIDMNYQNPITNTRTFGSNPERVLRVARAYMKGIHECNLAVSIKHWPGDGVDGRDQHLVTSINSLSVEEWDETYGRVYKGMIDAGADTVMAAHIMLPAYSRRLNPGIRDEKLMPASLAPELNYKLLREKLGFNGLIVTDATNMAGFTIAMSREMAVPATIAAGCDMFLLPLDPKEDLEFMMQGLEHGLLTAERLDEAVTRILALKASLQLHNINRRKKGHWFPMKLRWRY
ncbi:MAG: glycoside hydrolase family 3 N-terminal domain-containing protein [Spirochaetota bacterium]